MADYGYLLPTRGIVLSSDDEQTLAAKTQADVVGLAERAESAGFDAVWVGDSVLAKPRLEPLTTLAAAAAATESVDLGTAVYLPPLRHAVHVAHLTATVDQLSGGRFCFGLGVGGGDDVEAEYANLDVPYGTRGAHMDELLEVVRELWSGEAVDYDGDHVTLDDASIGFGPVRQPPVYVASAAFDPTKGFPATIRRRLETYEGWMPTGLSADAYGEARQRIESIRAEAGREPDTMDMAYYMNVVVDESEERALEAARTFYSQYYPVSDPPSDDTLRDIGAFGPPAHVASRLEDYADAGVENFVVRFTAADQRRQLGRFVDLVDA